MSVGFCETTVNGNRVQLWGQGHDSDARRVAAALPRATDGLRFVDAAYDGTVIWFDPVDDAPIRTVRAPDGYAIVAIDQLRDGTVVVTVRPEAEA